MEHAGDCLGSLGDTHAWCLGAEASYFRAVRSAKGAAAGDVPSPSSSLSPLLLPLPHEAGRLGMTLREGAREQQRKQAEAERRRLAEERWRKDQDMRARKKRFEARSKQRGSSKGRSPSKRSASLGWTLKMRASQSSPVAIALSSPHQTRDHVLARRRARDAERANWARDKVWPGGPALEVA